MRGLQLLADLLFPWSKPHLTGSKDCNRLLNYRNRKTGMGSNVFRYVLISAFLLAGNYTTAQDSSVLSKNIHQEPGHKKTEILSSGFMDIASNGQVNASARLVRIFLGEPGKFSLPLSIYSGVSAGSFPGSALSSGQRGNDHLLNGFINPLSGLLNASMEGIRFSTKKENQVTRLGLLYHLGSRVLTGYRTGNLADPLAGKAHNFFNLFGCTGIYFETGAWEKRDSGNLGRAWLTLRYAGSYSGLRSLVLVLPGVTNGFYHGYSLGGGIEIDEVIHTRIFYYKYIHSPGHGYAGPLYQFSFHYALDN